MHAAQPHHPVLVLLLFISCSWQLQAWAGDLCKMAGTISTHCTMCICMLCCCFMLLAVRRDVAAYTYTYQIRHPLPALQQA